LKLPFKRSVRAAEQDRPDIAAAGKVPHGNWKTVTFIAALRHDRIIAPFVLERPRLVKFSKPMSNSFLAPTLKSGGRSW
jgi:hypothetical protein